jgi:hypothetical protein
METVAERIAQYIVGHHPVMPGVGEAALSTPPATSKTVRSHHNDKPSVLMQGQKLVGRRLNETAFGNEEKCEYQAFVTHRCPIH